MYRLSEAKRADDVHAKASESVVKVRTFGILTGSPECSAQCLGLFSK
jgi:hypothetical protein